MDFFVVAAAAVPAALPFVCLEREERARAKKTEWKGRLRVQGIRAQKRRWSKKN